MNKSILLSSLLNAELSEVFAKNKISRTLVENVDTAKKISKILIKNCNKIYVILDSITYLEFNEILNKDSGLHFVNGKKIIILSKNADIEDLFYKYFNEDIQVDFKETVAIKHEENIVIDFSEKKPKKVKKESKKVYTETVMQTEKSNDSQQSASNEGMAL